MSRRMKHFVAALVASVALPAGLPAQLRCTAGTGRMVLIHGFRHAFTIVAPPGWTARAGYADQPAPALLYPEDQTWQDAPAVMYVNTVLPDSGRPASIARVMHDDSAKFRGEYPTMWMESLAPIRTADGRVVRLRKFAGGGYGSFDLVAYVDQRTVTSLIVLSTRSETAMTNALGAFRSLLQSYRFVTTRMAEKSKLPCGQTGRFNDRR